MVKAFVFGKFLPFHRGHEAMIHFALIKADLVSVLVCCSDKENIDGNVRQHWIKESFATIKNIEVKVFNYSEDKLTNSSVASAQVSQAWAAEFKKLYPDYSLLIASEPYGELVAGFMHIQHIAFDMNRSLFPVSATLIRANPVVQWQFLPSSVKPYFAVKVVILGTESTGKTTLTGLLAKHYGCSFVSEAGRDLIADSNEFSFEDLQLVATSHAKRIKETVIGESALVIIDTDIHITKSYSRFAFNKELEVSDDIYEANKGSLYLYLNNDVNYVQDGTRLHETERNLLDISHRQVLKQHAINIIEITGDWDERFNKAVSEINKLILK